MAQKNLTFSKSQFIFLHVEYKNKFSFSQTIIFSALFWKKLTKQNFSNSNCISSHPLTNSSISLSPKSNRSNLASDDNEGGNSFSKFSLNSSDVRAVNRPKSAGNEVSDMSLSPSTVRLLSWLKAGGSLGIGFELKSATWRARNAPILSGMSGISVKMHRNQI